jgi:hypothetical protein
MKVGHSHIGHHPQEELAKFGYKFKEETRKF